MDVLYILGKGSPFKNEELKYSLRSLERYGKNVDRLILVGEKPDFLNYDKVVHVPFDESGVKDYRIASKILHACETGVVTGDFLFCNDDFFFTKEFDANTFPFYHKGLMRITTGKGYQEHLQLTMEYLRYQGKMYYHFDVHCPIIYNAEKFMALKHVWEYSKTTIGLVVKSVYANWYGIKGTFYFDVKLQQMLDVGDLVLAHQNECFSIYDVAWNKGVKGFLELEFPNKSKYEI